MSAKYRHPWTENQIKLMHFVGRGKTTKGGERRTMQQFAEAIGVHRDTLYDWMQIPGWKEDMFAYSLSLDLDKMPMIKRAVMGKSLGLKNFKNVDIPAANLATKLFGVADRVESTVTADIKADVTHHLAGKSDDELDAIIKSATGA
jgi:hypothetical protein